MSVPPTIYPTVTYQTSYNQYCETNKTMAKEIQLLTSDEKFVKITNGIINGLTDPILEPGALVNKQYVISSKKPSGPIDSIQYNKNGIFKGSENIVFIGDYNSGILETKNISITDGVLELSGSKIQGSLSPILSDELATKIYADSFGNKMSQISISGSSAQYSNIISSLIYRTSETNVSDKLPQANTLMSVLENAIQVNVATSNNIILSGFPIIDSVQVLTGNKILVKAQNNPVENGVYTVGPVSWTRISVPNNSYFGIKVFVLSGSVNGNYTNICDGGHKDSYSGINKLFFKIVQTVPIMSRYIFGLINESMNSTVLLATNTGTSFITNISTPIIIPPKYSLDSYVYLTNIVPPEFKIDILSIAPNVKYLQNNFIKNTFRTSLSYKINNTFMKPGPSSLTTNNVTNYQYTVDDFNNRIIIRNPSANSSDGIGNLLMFGELIIQNISSNTITITGANSSGLWTISTITIGPNMMIKLIISFSGLQNIARSTNNQSF